MFPLAAHLRKLFGDKVFSEPGTMFLAGFSASTLVMYVFTGTFVLFLLKYKSTPVTKHPPSRFSTLNVWASGFGLIGLSVLLEINCTPSLDLNIDGFVDTILEGFSGKIPVA